ncbi:MAG: hypothetical protein LBK61_07615 [Spirochaetaceae bacterium]|nr:hypothetical protein [Spirochaetaceae bacterium]
MGSENPLGFHPFVNLLQFLPKISGAGRASPYGGCASPSGAQCHHKGVFCLPRTPPDWGGDE